MRVNDAGEIQVYVVLTEWRPEHVAELEALGLRVEATVPTRRLIQGWVPSHAVDDIAALDAVKEVKPPAYGMREGAGAVNTPGDAILGAAAARSAFGISGAGVKVGVISDGVDHLADSVMSDDLPAGVQVLAPGSGNEGTALLEIVHDLAPGAALGEAVDAVYKAKDELGMPASIQGEFQGAAAAFERALASEPLLILAAVITVYIVLGVLYESYVHPLTILSSLPSAGVGALVLLLLTGTDFSIIALIGLVLLIGIVKKNAIIMIDFALEAERKEHKQPLEAIREASLLRFRPIMMTTLAALFGGIPLALGTGTGSELRRPLGIAIVGGLLVSQLLTLYSTPVIYLWFDRLGRRIRGASPAAGNDRA